MNSSKQPLAEWDLKLLGDKGTTRSYFSLSDISDKKAQDDKDTKTKKKKQKKEENEDDDESSKKNKDDKKDKKRAKKGKVRVFVGQYLFSLMFFDFLGRFHICVELQYSVIGQPKFAYLSTISFLPCPSVSLLVHAVLFILSFHLSSD